jgi:hypothetical protein
MQPHFGSISEPPVSPNYRLIAPPSLRTVRPDGYLDFLRKIWLDCDGKPLGELLGWSGVSCVNYDAGVFVGKMRNSFVSTLLLVRALMQPEQGTYPSLALWAVLDGYPR